MAHATRPMAPNERCYRCARLNRPATTVYSGGCQLSTNCDVTGGGVALTLPKFWVVRKVLEVHMWEKFSLEVQNLTPKSLIWGNGALYSLSLIPKPLFFAAGNLYSVHPANASES